MHPFRRGYAKRSIDIPKKLQRVRDHAFDGYMEVQKKVRRALKLQDLILAHDRATLPLSRLDALSRRHAGLGPHQTGPFLLKHPHVFHVYDHPVQRVLWVRLTPRAARRVEAESAAVRAAAPSAALRLRNLLLLAHPHRLRLDHLRLASYDLAFPDDFERSFLRSHPDLFRLSPDNFIELTGPGPDPPPGCAVDRARELEYRALGRDAEDMRFAFPVRFPPGFKISKYFRVAMWRWQRLPYWSPYEDVSEHDLRSIEARRRMEKRAVAVIHEFLSLMVEKKTTLERMAQFRQAMGLPAKLKEFLLRHQGVFYVCTRGNRGKLHTVFLREAYKKGELVEPNPVYLARRRLDDLLLAGARDVNLDRMLTSLGRDVPSVLDPRQMIDRRRDSSGWTTDD